MAQSRANLLAPLNHVWALIPHEVYCSSAQLQFAHRLGGKMPKVSLISTSEAHCPNRESLPRFMGDRVTNQAAGIVELKQIRFFDVIPEPQRM